MNVIEQLEQEAEVFGLEWETKDQIMTHIRNACLEIEEHLYSPEQRDALEDEIGDLLHAAFSLCVFNNFSPEVTLRKSLDKFEHRWDAMKDIAKEQGLPHLRGKSFDELMQYWGLATNFRNFRTIFKHKLSGFSFRREPRHV